MKKEKFILVHNTHWDYEWYFTESQSNALFHYHMKELLYALENNLISYYVLDGQIGLVLKYLNKFPEDRERLIKLNKTGKISLGPWFTQTDTLIVSTENIVHNLYLGIKASDELGGSWKLAYCPDIFGQGNNMPKIYNGFGIAHHVFFRGLAVERFSNREFKWKADDESEVLSYNYNESYFRSPFINHPGKPFTAGYAKITENYDDANIYVFDSARGRTKIDDVNVISWGSDQRHVPLNAKDHLKRLKKKIDAEIVEGRFEDYFDHYKDIELDYLEGEMIHGQQGRIHRTIWSHRSDHKIMQDYVERLLTYTLEPLITMAEGIGMNTLHDVTKQVWELLSFNSAHDSSGACNSDRTNTHITTRYLRAIEITESYIELIKRKIIENTNEIGDLVLINTTQEQKEEFTDIKIITKKPNFEIKDIDGNEVKFKILSEEKFYTGPNVREEKDEKPGHYQFESKLHIYKKTKPFSFTTLKVSELEDETFSCNWTDNNFVENNSLKLEFKDGEISLFKKQEKKVINNFLSLISDADDGDTYDWSPLENAERISVDLSGLSSKANNNEGPKQLKLFGKIKLIKDLDSWQNDKKIIQQEIEILLSLNEQNVTAKINTTNKAKEQRLRLRINTNLDYKYSLAESHYGYIKRPLKEKYMEIWKENGWWCEPTSIYPLLNNVIAEDEQSKVSITSTGIKEYQFLEEGQVELTLYRTVGFMGKPDLVRRPNEASGNKTRWVPTPDSQLLNKELEYEIYIQFLDSSVILSDIKNQANAFITKDEYYQYQNIDKFAGILNCFTINTLIGEVEQDSYLFENIKYDKNVVQSILKTISSEEFIIRFFNQSDDTVRNSVEIDFKYEVEVEETNLLNEKIATIPSEDNKISNIELKPHQVKTILIRRKNEWTKI